MSRIAPLAYFVPHLLPNCLPPLIVIATQQVARAIALEATLSFLGLGVPITEPSLGLLIANGYQYICRKYWISFYPGIALLVHDRVDQPRRRSVARRAEPAVAAMTATLDVQNLRTHFFHRAGVVKRSTTCRSASKKGEVLGLVGASGSGKSVTGFSVIGLIDPPGRIVGGSIDMGRRLTTFPEPKMRALRGTGSR